MKLNYFLLFILAFFLFNCSINEKSEDFIDYNTQVKPILNKNCIACHGGVKKQGGFSLLFEEEAKGLTKSGHRAIIPRFPEKSSFIQRLQSKDPEEKMPYQRQALNKNEIDILTQWVREGAKWGTHWAYQKLEKPKVPKGSIWSQFLDFIGLDNAWESNDLDYFVSNEHKQQGLSHSDKATKSELLRRLYLDLIGISPTKKEYEKFENDQNKNAYEKQVDRLLVNPQFGEKWASMWMDLARYADTKGYEKDDARTIWKYRDYVIQSFNENKPYDLFIKEQLAGDLFPNPKESDYIATAFHRNTANNDEGGTDDEEFRTAAILDRVNTTWEVLQGTSFNCVQCHSHPYDPIKHEEYYQYMALFNNTRDEDIPDDSPNFRHYKATDIGKLDSIKNYLKSQPLQVQKEWLTMIQFVEPKIHPHWADQHINAALADNKYLAARNRGSVRFKAVPMNGKTNLLIACKNNGPAPTYLTIRKNTKQGEIISKIKLDTTLQEKYAGPKGYWVKGWAYVFFKIPAIQGKQDLIWEFSNSKTEADQNTCTIGFWALMPEIPNNLKSSDFNLLSTKLIQSQPESSTPIILENPKDFTRETRIFERGSWLNPGKVVKRGVPAIFNQKNINDRLALANWMGGKENPLTSRVAVNRFWEQLFGTGIAETLEDLGSQGLAPSNQALLDHLAYKFQFEFNYQPKELIKYIVMSSTYQQTSKRTGKESDKDPFNRYLSRGPRIRLNPEQLRDQALAWAGILSQKMGGPSVMPEQPDGIWNAPYSGMQWKKSNGEDQWRRSLYTYWRRSSPYPTMVAFDAGTRDLCLSRRIRTNTPLQALNALNDPVFMEAAQFFARKFPLDFNENFIKKSYFEMFGTEISSQKSKILMDYYTKTKAYYASNMTASKQFLKWCPDNIYPKNASDLITKTLVSNVLFNLDESVVK
ncbi:PSD1 and planctomycete cytochrome C domain-containing protein [Aquirufa sp. ROCK-SH2]